MDGVVELSALLLQAFRGPYDSSRDTTASVQAVLPQICPPYALEKGSVPVKATPRGVVLNSVAGALTPWDMADRLVAQYSGAKLLRNLRPRAVFFIFHKTLLCCVSFPPVLPCAAL
jgi:hypothetical protein